MKWVPEEETRTAVQCAQRGLQRLNHRTTAAEIGKAGIRYEQNDPGKKIVNQ